MKPNHLGLHETQDGSWTISFPGAAAAFSCFGGGLPQHWYAANQSGYPALGTRISGGTPPTWYVDHSISNSAMNEASWLIGGGGSNPGQSIEVGYFSGYWGYSPGSGWFSGLLPYYTLNDGYGPAVRGSTYLPAGTGMTFDAISGGRAKVASYNTTYFNQTFTYAVSDGLNFAQGEVLNSTATWLGGGSTNGFSGYWTNNGVNWYYWGNQSKCANSPYWDILQANPWDYRNGGY